MFEITNEKPELRNNMMQPIVKNNIQLNSIGFIAQKSDAISMRGPMISKAIDQLFLKTNWLELDYLIIDTPPGTNDVHLQIMQNYKINDIILVTQNSKLALADNIRTITFYKNFNMDIMCIVENEIFMNNNKDEIIPGYKTHKISPLKEFAHFNITDITNVEIYYQNLKNLVNQIIAKK
jgi:ATP-binding protein involved in chromosome partitioning